MHADPDSAALPARDGDRVRFACGTCGRELRAPLDRVGQTASCPTCGTEVTVPSLPPDPAPTTLEEWDEPTPPIGPRPLVCEMCGATNDPRDTVCRTCGEDLPEPDDAAASTRRRPEGRGVIDLGLVFSDGWELFKQDYGRILGLGGLYLLAAVVIGGIVSGPLIGASLYLQIENQQPNGQVAGGIVFVISALQTVASVLGQMVAAFLGVGWARIMLRIARPTSCLPTAGGSCRRRCARGCS